MKVSTLHYKLLYEYRNLGIKDFISDSNLKVSALELTYNGQLCNIGISFLI